MKTDRCFVGCAALAALCGATSAQSGGTYVSGLLHQPLGAAVVIPLDDRTAAVGNIGSSGEDGVEVLCDSVRGGGVTVDISPLLGATGAAREIKIRPKGWDGTIKGNMRLIGDPDGLLTEVYDFTDIGASAMRWKLFGAAGEVLAQGSVSGAVLTWGLQVDAAPGVACGKRYVVSGTGSIMREALQGFFDVVVTVSGLTTEPVAGVQSIAVEPEPCAGLPENCPPTWADLSSLILTGSGVTELTVSDTGLHTLGVHASGVGQVHLSELRESPTRQTLRLDNLGSSGQDGVAIHPPRDNGGINVAVAKGNCCRGHVIIMKLYDDEGHEARVSQTQSTDAAGTEELDADFSSLGASGFHLTLFDASGNVVGPPHGTEFAAGSPRPLLTSPCTPGQPESWAAAGTNVPPGRIVVIRRPIGCSAGYAVTLPGQAPVTGVDSFRIEPIGATSTFGRLDRCVITSTDDEGLVIESATIPRAGKYVSGLLHQPLGGATLGTVAGRRLSVRNLGSSGEDGVEVRLNSYWGGSCGVDLAPLVGSGSSGVAGSTLAKSSDGGATPGLATTKPVQEIKIRIRGWDGLIYGTHRIGGSGTGPTIQHDVDFASIGAESIDWALVNAGGVVVDQGNVTGAVLEYTTDLSSTNPAFPPSLVCKVSLQDISLFPPVRRPVHRAILRDAVGTVTSAIWSPRSNIVEVRLTPRLPLGTPPPGVVASMEVTGEGLTGFDITESSIGAFGAECFAEQPGAVLFERLPGGAYPPPDRWLEASSATGHPDVSVAAGPTGTPGTLAMSAKGNCCRGHVIIMKAYDDDNQELGRLIKTHDPVAGQSSFAFDCSAVGSAQCDVELFDSFGSSLATLRVANGTSFSFADVDADCPGDSGNEWSAAMLLPAVQKLREFRCSPIGLLELPDGSAISGVQSYACTPVGPTVTTSGKRLRLTATGTYSDGTPAGIVVTGASFAPGPVTPASDFDGDGDVDLSDFARFQACFNGPNRPPVTSDCDDADLDDDNDVDLGDFAVFQTCFNGPNRAPACS